MVQRQSETSQQTIVINCVPLFAGDGDDDGGDGDGDDDDDVSLNRWSLLRHSNRRRGM